MDQLDEEIISTLINDENKSPTLINRLKYSYSRGFGLKTFSLPLSVRIYWELRLTLFHSTQQFSKTNLKKSQSCENPARGYVFSLHPDRSSSLQQPSLRPHGLCRTQCELKVDWWISSSIFMFSTATTKHLVYFSLDYRGEVQELTFDQSQVRRLFYGSFHKVR